ncbi:uncharacterized protein METZ01_LOCUS251941, partial [marine metagenome]
MTTLQSHPDKLSKDQQPAFSCADIVFNLPLKDAFTYEIPLHFNGMIKKGMRVFVPFGRRRITGYVVDISNRQKKNILLKAIEEVPDSEPVISKELLSLTRWIADYYHSSWGEAIKAALPAGLDDTSLDELHLTEKGLKVLKEGNPSSKATYILQTLHLKKKLTSRQLERSLKKKYSAGTLASLKRDELVKVENKIKRSFLKYKYEKIIRTAKNLPKKEEIEKLLKRSPKQRAVYEFLRKGEASTSDLNNKIPGSSQTIKKLLDKNIVEIFTSKKEQESTHSNRVPKQTVEKPLQMNKEQEECYRAVKQSIEKSVFQPYLLHGVTGSGKTEIY